MKKKARKKAKRKPVPKRWLSAHDTHHIQPKSRAPELIDDPENLKEVPLHYHQAYHLLFHNMIPKEVIKYLKDVWFKPGFLNDFIAPEEWLKGG